MEYYIKKENRLSTAIKKVQKKLDFFKSWTNENLHNNYDALSRAERRKIRKKIDSFRWNEYHDLKYRLEERQKENYYNSKSKDLEKFGFVAY